MKKYLFIVLICGFSLVSCLEEFENLGQDSSLSLSPKIGFPLLDSHILFSDFESDIENFEISALEDGTVLLSYSQSIFEAMAEDYFSILYQTSPVVTLTGLSSGGLPLTGTMEASGSDVLQVEVDGEERIDSARLKSGTLKLIVNSSYTVDATVNFVINKLTINGQPFQQEMTISAGYNELSVDIANSFFDLTLTGSEYNQLGFEVFLTLSANGNIVLPTESIEASFEIIDPRFTLIVGESGFRSIEDRMGTEPVSTLGEVEIGNFVIADPSVELTISNSFGVQFEVDLGSLSVLTKEGQTKNLTGDIVDVQNPFQILAPDISAIGNSVITSIDVNSANSNIAELVSGIPSEFSYAATALYPGSDAKIFVMDTSKVAISGIARIPLYGSVMSLEVSREFDFEIGSDLDELKNAELKIQTGNRYPISVGVTLEFRNSAGDVLLSLLTDDPSITEAAPVDQNGNATDIAHNEVIIALSEDDFEILKGASSLEVIFSLSTTNDGDTLVRLREDDYLDLKMSISGELKLDL